MTAPAIAGEPRVLDWPAMKVVEPRLEALALLVLVVAGHVDADGERPMCYGCAWERAVKPLLYPLVGWGRGYVEQAGDPDRSWSEPEDRGMAIRIRARRPDAGPRSALERLGARTLGEVVAETDRLAPGTGTERFLRSSAAWDVASEHLLAILYTADPASGCGLGAADPAAIRPYREQLAEHGW